MDTSQMKKKTNKFIIPIIIALGFIPLVVHQVEYDDELSQFDWFVSNGGKSTDFFLASKMAAIIAVGIVMLGIILYRHFQKNESLRFENGFYALFFYGLFVAMSALLSHYKHWVACGTYQMFESVWVVFAYMVFCYYTYQYVTDEAQVYSILKWGGIGVVLLAVLGTFQFIGLDFFKSMVGRVLITNPSQWSNLDTIEFRVPKHTVYATLYNQNYLSFYSGMLIPLVLALMITCKKNVQRIILIVVEIMLIACMIGASSSSGWLALAGSSAVVAFVLCSRKRKTMIAAVTAAGVGLVALVVVCVTTPIGNKISTALLGEPNKNAVQAIDTTGDCIMMEINGQELKVTYDYDETGSVVIECKNADDQVLSATSTSENSATSVIDDEKYLGCSVTPTMMSGVLTMNITVDGHSWYFTKGGDGSYVMINQSGKCENYKSTKFVPLFHDNAFSNRGHIWNGALTVAKKYIFIGSGANTFLFAYPQNDYIYREYMNTQNIFDVKAHSLYLQQWIENSLIGLFAFLVFCIIYLINCIRIYRKADLHESLTWIGIGLFTGILTYLIVGLANDSNVNTAPVFWILIGLGMAVNRIIAKKQNLFVSVQKEQVTETALETPKPPVRHTGKRKPTKRERQNRKKS